jgi:ribosome-associated protein
MDIRTLQRVIFDALEDVKAQDIRVFDTVGMTSLFDRVIIACGTSNRQTRALAMHVHEKVKAAGGHIISMEGEETGEWVLVDAGDAVVHVMQPAIRQYYNLEELWGAKQVDMTLTEKEAVKKAPAKKASKTTAAAPPTAKETAAAKKSSAKAVPAKTVAVKKSVAKTAAAKKPASKKPAEKKAVTTKAAGK